MRLEVLIMTNTTEIIERGMNCLLENLGTMEMETFISVIIRERFNYTEWRKDFFGDKSVQEINCAAIEYAKKYPFAPTKITHE